MAPGSCVLAEQSAILGLEDAFANACGAREAALIRHRQNCGQFVTGGLRRRLGLAPTRDGRFEGWKL